MYCFLGKPNEIPFNAPYVFIITKSIGIVIFYYFCHRLNNIIQMSKANAIMYHSLFGLYNNIYIQTYISHLLLPQCFIITESNVIFIKSKKLAINWSHQYIIINYLIYAILYKILLFSQEKSLFWCYVPILYVLKALSKRRYNPAIYLFNVFIVTKSMAFVIFCYFCHRL